MKNYFDFIMYLAFRTILEYENKRSLTVSELHDYRKKLMEKNIEYYSQFDEYDDEEFEEKIRFFLSSNTSMTLVEEGQNLINFISDKKITYKDLVDANFELGSYKDKDDKLICGKLISISDCIECLDVIGATKVKKFVYNIIEDEKKIEHAYHSYSGFELEKNIKKLLVLVYYRLTLISNLKDDKLRCYYRTLKNLGKVDTDSKGKEVRLLSDYLIENDKFYNLNDRSIDSILNDKYQRAIFGDGTLVYAKLLSIMDAIWSYRNPNMQYEIELIDPDAIFSSIEEHLEELASFEDEFEDDKTNFQEYSEEYETDSIDDYLYRKRVEMTFYLNYINHIDKFLKIKDSDEDLKNSKSRLLYLLDSYGDNLFKEENYNQALCNISMSEINYREDFADFYALSRLFLVDILEGWIDDEMYLKKMLLVSTYYDLTKDNRIKKIINKYKKTELGYKVSEIILESNYNQLVSSFSPITKKLIKKKPDIK